MKRFCICLFIFLLSCSVSNKDESYKYSQKLYSKDYRYALKYEATIPVKDSLRVDDFMVYKLTNSIRSRLQRREEISDSLFEKHQLVTPDSLQDIVDLDEDGRPIRNFRVIYHKSDVFYDSMFTQQPFSWNLEDSTLHFSGTGLTIKLE